MSILRFCRAAVAVAVLLPTLAIAGVPEVEPGNDFQGISYSISTSGVVVIYAGIRNVNGKLAVCGLVFFEKKANATTRSAEKGISENIRFKVGGTAVKVTTRSFKRYMTEEEARGKTAGCSVTGKAWQDGYGKAKLTLALSAGNFRY